MTSRHRLPLRNSDDRKRAWAWLDRAPLGKGWRVEFLPPVRSTDQNRRLWAFLDDVAAQKEWAGRKWPSECWKDLFSAALRGQQMVPNLDGNGFIAFGARTSEMSPEEMSDLLQLIETWGVQHGVIFTDTDTAPSSGERAPAADGSGLAGARELSEGEE